jgi:hypothetical protein
VAFACVAVGSTSALSSNGTNVDSGAIEVSAAAAAKATTLAR